MSLLSQVGEHMSTGFLRCMRMCPLICKQRVEPRLKIPLIQTQLQDLYQQKLVLMVHGSRGVLNLCLVLVLQWLWKPMRSSTLERRPN